MYYNGMYCVMLKYTVTYCNILKYTVNVKLCPDIPKYTVTY